MTYDEAITHDKTADAMLREREDTLAQIDADAQAALERVKQEARNEALREAAEAADRVSRRGKHGHDGVPWSGWSQSEYKKYKWSALDVKHEIEKLITEDQSDDRQNKLA